MYFIRCSEWLAPTATSLCRTNRTTSSHQRILDIFIIIHIFSIKVNTAIQ